MSAPSVIERIGVPRLLALLVALAAAARVVACFVDGPAHPDEYFQYLEPAWWHLTGAGVETWEWSDGIRSWVLPTYHGAWLSALMSLGVPHGRPLVWFLKVHWALVNTALVIVAFRGAAAGARSIVRAREGDGAAGYTGAEAGLLGALLVGAFPLLVTYGSHTLSEMPSMLCLVAGLVLVVELQERPAAEVNSALGRKAALAGALLSLGACLRIANAPMVLLPPLWLLFTRRYRAFGHLVLGALGPALVFALVDLITWGSLASSFVGYVKFNLIEGKASDFGTEPALFYFTQLGVRLPYTLLLVVVIPCLALRATWPFVASAAIALGYLSTQAHKEERFTLLVWPLLLTPCAAVVGAWLARLRREGKLSLGRRSITPRMFAGLLTLGVLGLLVDGGLHAGGREWPVQARLDAQAWAGRQSDLTGLLLDFPIDGGGALWFGSLMPQVQYGRGLLKNPLFSHVVAESGSKRERESLRAGFTRVYRTEDFVVLKRTPSQ